jgi:hypothetical protein
MTIKLGVPEIGSEGYFSKGDFENVMKKYIAPALNGLSLAVDELQKTVDELEKASRRIDVHVHIDRGASEEIAEETKIGGEG